MLHHFGSKVSWENGNLIYKRYGFLSLFFSLTLFFQPFSLGNLFKSKEKVHFLHL